MQKFLFAVQVFGIIAMFPIYVILEMNHELPGNKNHPGVTGKPEKTIIRVPLNSEAQIENSITGKMLAVSNDTLSKNEIKKGLAKEGYKTN